MLSRVPSAYPTMPRVQLPIPAIGPQTRVFTRPTAAATARAAGHLPPPQQPQPRQQNPTRAGHGAQAQPQLVWHCCLWAGRPSRAGPSWRRRKDLDAPGIRDRDIHVHLRHLDVHGHPPAASTPHVGQAATWSPKATGRPAGARRCGEGHVQAVPHSPPPLFSRSSAAVGKTCRALRLRPCLRQGQGRAPARRSAHPRKKVLGARQAPAPAPIAPSSCH